MPKYRRFIRRYYIPLTIVSFFIVGLPQWIDSILSLIERASSMNESGLNITWLYGITVPIGLSMFFYIIWQVTRVSGEESKGAWEHYNKLTDLILSMETEPHESWNTIVADMQKELNAIGDNKISKMMQPYYDVIDEDEHVGIKPNRATSNITLERMRDYMNRKYKRY